MRTRAFAGRLAQTVHAYPTWSYGLQKPQGNSSVRWRDEHGGRRAEVLRLAGLAVTLLAAVVWASWQPAHRPPLSRRPADRGVSLACDRWVGRRRSDPAPIGECRARRICAGHGDGDHSRSEGRSRRPDTLGNAGNRGCPRRTRRVAQSVQSPGSSTQCGRPARHPGRVSLSSIRRRSRRTEPFGRGSDRSTVQVCLTCSSRSAVT